MAFKCNRCGKRREADTIHSCHHKYPKRLVMDNEPPQGFQTIIDQICPGDTPEDRAVFDKMFSSHPLEEINKHLSRNWDDFMCAMNSHKDCKGHLYRGKEN